MNGHGLHWSAVAPGCWTAYAVNGPAGLYMMQKVNRFWYLHYPDGHGNHRSRPDDIYRTLSEAKQAAEHYDTQPHQGELF